MELIDMEEEIKGVKISKEQQKQLLKDRCWIVDKNEHISTYLKDYISRPNQHIVYMSESLFNFVYGLYRSNDNCFCNLINKKTLTYNSFMESIDAIVDDYIDDYYNDLHKIILVFDTLFDYSGQMTTAYKMFKKFHECCLKKGIKNTPKDFYLFEVNNMFIYTLYNYNSGARKFHDKIRVWQLDDNIFSYYKNRFYGYWEFVKTQANSYFSNLNNTISLYNIIKDDKQLQQIFSKLENLHFKKETKNTSFGIRNTFVRPVKNEKGKFIAFYSICFVECKEYQDIRIEPYVFMPNISVNESKIPERFNNLINQKILSRFEAINLLVNYNLLLLLNDECNLNMTKDNMDIDKISLWFGSREHTEPTFVDLLTDYNKPLYSFQEMDNILKNEALNVLGNGNQELLNAVIKDAVFYLRFQDLNKKPSRFEDAMAYQKRENNLFSKINIRDDNFSFVIAQMYRYMSDGFISCMHSSMYDSSSKTEILSNNYVPTNAAILLMIAHYYEHYIALCRIDEITLSDVDWKKELIDKFYCNDKHLAFEFKELAIALNEAHYSFLSFYSLFDCVTKIDYVSEQYEDYPSNNIYAQAVFLCNKWLHEVQEFETMLASDSKYPHFEKKYPEGNAYTKGK